MSKKIKSMIENQTASTLKSLEGAAVVNPVGIDGNRTNNLRRKLREQGMKMLVVRNALARRAMGATKLKGFDKLLEGPSAVVYTEKGEVTAIARVLAEAKKADDKLELRGIYFDGEVFAGAAGVEQVSKFPTRLEAIGQVVGALLGPASQIVGALNQGGMVASLVEAVEKKGANG